MPKTTEESLEEAVKLLTDLVKDNKEVLDLDRKSVV